ncbi:hypothetical protein KIN20_026430 [Parelaphostrongylus tenuis]|uniref:Uncharacterized protein n=1 Tax=Parelaphostrongylus tenuis TaxID=148309 RepID=A0AAD5QY14_PARTN|nr:hypothetical protein KIN20_026430 [Parelaphostrongylus tenuis]
MCHILGPFDHLINGKIKGEDPPTNSNSMADEHYEEINKLRVADRAKWKYFNKKVEELEVVAQSDISTARVKSNSDSKKKNGNTNDSAKRNTRMQALSPRVDGLQVAKLVAIPIVHEHTDDMTKKKVKIVSAVPEFYTESDYYTMAKNYFEFYA